MAAPITAELTYKMNLPSGNFQVMVQLHDCGPWPERQYSIQVACLDKTDGRAIALNMESVDRAFFWTEDGYAFSLAKAEAAGYDEDLRMVMRTCVMAADASLRTFLSMGVL